MVALKKSVKFYTFGGGGSKNKIVIVFKVMFEIHFGKKIWVNKLGGGPDTDFWI